MATRTLQVVIEGNETGARRAFSGVDSAAGQAATGVRSKLGGAFSQLDTLLGSFGIPFSNVLGQLGTKLDDFESKGASNFQKLGEAGKAVALGLTAVAAGIAIESVHLADSYEKVHANLETAFKNSGSSLDAYSGKIDAQASKFATLGHNQTDYEAALGALTTALNNPNKALSEMGLVADVAAKSGKGLKESAIAVAKAQEGQLRPLKQLGIDLPIAATSAVKLKTAQDGLARAQLIGAGIQAKVASGQLTGQKATDALNKAFLGVAAAQDKVNTAEGTGDAVLKALHERLGGAAAAQAATFQGKLRGLHATLTDVGIKIGMFLIPIIAKLVGWLSVSITWFEKHKTIALILAGVIGGVLVAAIGAAIASSAIFAGVLAVLTSPITAVVLAVLAVAAGIIYVWTHWDQIWNWIKDHPAYAIIIAILAWPIAAFVLIIGGLKTLWENWGLVWSSIQSLIQTVWGVLAPIFGAIGGALSDIWGAVQYLWGIWTTVWGAVGGVAGAAAGAVSSALSPIISVLGTIIGLAQTAAQAISDVGSFVTGSSGNINDVPARQRAILNQLGYGAEGGIVSSPTLALIGEAGPEAVVPLNRMPGVSALPGGGGSPPSTGPLTIQVMLDGKVAAEVVATHFNTPGGPQIRSRAVSNR